MFKIITYAYSQNIYSSRKIETGIKYRMNRSIQVEGAFGVLRNDIKTRSLLKYAKNQGRTSRAGVFPDFHFDKRRSAAQ